MHSQCYFKFEIPNGHIDDWGSNLLGEQSMRLQASGTKILPEGNTCLPNFGQIIMTLTFGDQQ